MVVYQGFHNCSVATVSLTTNGIGPRYRLGLVICKSPGQRPLNFQLISASLEWTAMLLSLLMIGLGGR